MKSHQKFLIGAAIAAAITAQLGAAPVKCTVAELGPNHRVLRASPDARRPDTPGRSVVELQTGMNYWDGQQWVPSEPAFEAVQGGFAATRMQAKVYLSADIAVRGAVTLINPDGTVTLNSTPVGIALLDPVSGRFGLIASLTNSIGVYVSTNHDQVLYQNAFRGVCADILYTLKNGSFSQDILFTGRLSPADWGFPENSRLQVITEFYGAPQPDRLVQPLYTERNEAVRNTLAVPDFLDEMLNFGDLSFAMGHVLTMGLDSLAEDTGVPVAKEFTRTVDQRAFLIESVRYPSVMQQLKGLPECKMGSAAIIRSSREAGYAAIPTLTGKRYAQNLPLDGAPRQVVVATARAPRSVAIDYLVNLTSETLLRGDTTYLVSGGFTPSSLTIEAGAVIKYVSGMEICVGSSGGGLITKATQYRPIIFTAVDDDSVGETMNGFTSQYTGTLLDTQGQEKRYADPALCIYQSVDLTNCWFRYARRAISNAGYPASLRVSATHSQFFHCVRGIVINGQGCGTGASPGTSVIIANNTLFADVDTVLTFPDMGMYGTCAINNCTFDGAGTVFTGLNGISNRSAASTNSIYANCSSLGFAAVGEHNGFYHAPKFGTSQYGDDAAPTPFAVFEGGSYYLDPNAGQNYFHACGTTASMPSWLVSDLGRRTTQAPIALGDIFAETELTTLQAARDGMAPPDLGYHYDPIDYVVQHRYLGESLTIGSGVIIGISGESNDLDYGLDVQQNGDLFTLGAPNSLSGICYEGNVQEQAQFDVDPNTKAFFNSNVKFLRVSSIGLTPTLRFRFTEVWMPCGHDNVPLLGYYQGSKDVGGEFSLRDCQLHGAYLEVNNSDAAAGFNPELKFALTNNILERCHIVATRPNISPLPRVQHYAYNNLFKGGSIAFTYNGATTGDYVWYVQNNFFDTASQSLSGSPGAYFTATKNGYSIGTANGIGGSSPLYNVTPNYLSGPLGPYYYSTTPYDGINRLINTGDRSAPAAGLYHYTTKINFPSTLTTCASTAYAEEKERTTTVDIGFHYVAVDQNGSPIDSNADGIPDYLADANGNGVSEQAAGERVWDMVITSPPKDVTVSQLGNQSAEFSVAACGLANLSYQWYKDGISLGPLYTATTLSITRVEASDLGVYKVTVTDGIGTQLSASAILALKGDQSGTDFWLAYPISVDTSCDVGLQLVVSGRSDNAGTANTTIAFADGSASVVVHPAPGASISTTLNPSLMLSSAVEDKGIHVSSDLPVSVVAFYNANQASEAFRIYPTARLGTSYRVLSRATPDGRSVLAVTATHDASTVWVTPSASSGLPQIPFSVALDQGQTYQLTTVQDGGYDLTGTYVSSDWPVAVLAGVDFVAEPDQNQQHANPEMEQQIPVGFWGTRAFAIPFAGRGTGANSYRVVANENGTQFTVSDGTTTKTLNLDAGQKSDSSDPGWSGLNLELPLDFASANHPIQVAHISNSYSAANNTGDPFEVLAPHIGQFAQNCVIWVPQSMDQCPTWPYVAGFDWLNYVSLIVSSADTSRISLDGTQVSPSLFQPLGNSTGYSYARIQLSTSGSHVISSSGGPIGVEVYGVSPGQTYDGYGYLGGITF